MFRFLYPEKLFSVCYNKFSIFVVFSCIGVGYEEVWKTQLFRMKYVCNLSYIGKRVGGKAKVV